MPTASVCDGVQYRLCSKEVGDIIMDKLRTSYYVNDRFQNVSFPLNPLKVVYSMTSEHSLHSDFRNVCVILA